MSRRTIRRTSSVRCHTRRSLCLALAAVPLLTLRAMAAYPSSWLSPLSGHWNDVTKWSTPWSYPNNATNAFSATINAAGNPYAVRFAIPEGVAVSGVTVRSPDVTLLHTAGTLTVEDFSSGLLLGGGARYELSGGTLNLGRYGGGVIGHHGAGAFVHTGGTVVQRGSVAVGFGGSLGTGVGSLLIDGHNTRWISIPD